MMTGENRLRRMSYLTMAALTLLFATAAQAQVKRIELRIDGYLCGN
jgi:hypothetical protein